MKVSRGAWFSLLFLIVLLIGLVINMPVQQVLNRISLPGTIYLGDVEGSFTLGSIGSIQVQGVEFKNVDYRFLPSCLVRLSACYRLNADDGSLFVSVEANLLSREIQFTDSRIELDSDVLAQIPQLLIRPKGYFILQAQQLTLYNSRISELELNLDWLDAGIQGEEQVLGAYSARIQRLPEKINIKLEDKQALLKLDGSIDVDWKGAYDISLKLQSQRGLNPSIQNALDLFGQKSGLNQSSIQKKGKLQANQLKYLKVLSPLDNAER